MNTLPLPAAHSAASSDMSKATLTKCASEEARSFRWPARIGPSLIAERTLALAQLDRRQNPDHGFARLLEPMVRPVLCRCLERGIPIVSNFGAANPRAAAHRIQQIARAQGRSKIRVAVIEGDDLS